MFLKVKFTELQNVRLVKRTCIPAITADFSLKEAIMTVQNLLQTLFPTRKGQIFVIISKKGIILNTSLPARHLKMMQKPLSTHFSGNLADLW